MIGWIIAGLAFRELIVGIQGIGERQQIFRQAKAYADDMGKPLLVIGAPRWGFNHPCGDVTIDNMSMGAAGLGSACDVEVADVRDIPYPGGYFGAAYCSHVLEHLPTIDDAIIALEEMERVADKVFTVSPHKDSLLAWLYPEHYLWVIPSGDGYVIEQRRQGTPKAEQHWEVSGYGRV